MSSLSLSDSDSQNDQNPPKSRPEIMRLLKKMVLLKRKLDETVSSWENRVAQIEEQNNQLEQRIGMLEDQMQRQMKSIELRIIGVPVSHENNLTEVFLAIAKWLEVDVSNPVNIPRLKKIYNNRSDARQCTVIAQFASQPIRNEFFCCYLRNIKRRLTTSMLGLADSDDNRILIVENLTKSNKMIFNEAMKLRKEEQIHQVFTKNGLVHIRIKKDAIATVIRNTNEMHQILADQPTSDENISQT